MKRFVKNVLLKICATFVRDTTSRIVYYHDVGTRYTNMGTPVDQFWSHLEVAKKLGFDFAESFDDLKSRPRQKLLLGFDDGFRGLYDVREEFYARGLTATVSLAIDLVGKPGYMTWKEIRELSSRGFHFVSHTWSHRSLTEVFECELEHELLDSRLAIADRIGSDVKTLCFPRGLFSRKVLAFAKDFGYEDCLTCIPGSINANINRQLRISDVTLVARDLVQFLGTDSYSSVLRGGMSMFACRYAKQHFVGEGQ